MENTFTSNTNTLSGKRRGRPTVYPRIRKQMMDMLENSNLAPGAALPTENVLSEHFGASRPLIRRALAELAQQGKIVSLPGKGHFVSRSSGAGGQVSGNTAQNKTIATTTTKKHSAIVAAIGSTVSRFLQVDDPEGTGAIINGLESVISETAHSLFWEISGAQHRSAGEMVKSHFSNMCAGAFIPLSDQPVGEYLTSIPQEMPSVVIGRPSGVDGVPCVYVDHKKGMQRAMNYLLGFGHRQIGYIGDAVSSFPATGRWEAYVEGMTEYGMEEYIKNLSASAFIVDGYETYVQKLVTHLLKTNPQITALVVGHGTILPWVCRAVEAQGLKIGDDFSLLSFDDLLYSRQYLPAITVVRQPTRQMGEIGARMILEQLGEVEPRYSYEPQKNEPSAYGGLESGINANAGWGEPANSASANQMRNYEVILDCDLIVRDSVRAVQDRNYVNT